MINLSAGAALRRMTASVRMPTLQLDFMSAGLNVDPVGGGRRLAEERDPAIRVNG
jgi:hypothetical protein